MFPLKESSSYIGFVISGYLKIETNKMCRHALFGEAFSINSTGYIEANGSTIVVEVLHTQGDYPQTGFRAMNLSTGRLESEGRLKYIDGCTDSLLIPPVKMGDPCLNHLHFPPNIDQTQHTHPSHRIGVVYKGHGTCVTPFGEVELTPGLIFIIREWDGETMALGLDGNSYPIGTHAFRTYGEPMDVIAFHPDSDFGATDVNHPMINRTYVDGVAASQIEEIQTK
jgi:hypothetical protein